MPEPFGRLYIAAFSLVTLVALAVAVRTRPRITLLRPDYRRLLTRPWKLATFALALVAMVGIAPYTGDPSWDAVTGGGMSLLAFTTAPWSVGVLFRRVRVREGRPGGRELFCAVVAWLFSASWSYDAYLYLRDGRYISFWLENLFASSALYLICGVLWSLEPAPPGRGLLGATLAFARPDWPAPAPSSARLGRAAWAAALLIAFTVLLMVPFLIATWEALSAHG